MSAVDHHLGQLRGLAGACGVLVLALACGAPTDTSPPPAAATTVLRPIHRFVDAGYVADTGTGRAGPATATIRDETRLALPYPRQEPLMGRRDLVVPADGPLVFDLPVPRRSPAWLDAQRIVALPNVRVDGEWRELPPVVTPVLEREGLRVVHLEVAVPTDHGDEVGVRVRGHPVTPPSKLATRPVEIPAGAILEIGLGILPAAWGEGPVAFSVSACAADRCESVFSEILDPTEPSRRDWQDRSVSLARLAGTRRRFEFEASRVQGGDGFTLPLWANPTIVAPEPRRAGDVNVILLSIDTLRADHLNSYGYAHETAPFIDRFIAARGTVFEACEAQAPSTTQSHMTMFTSLFPKTHRTWGLKPLHPAIPTFPQMLRAAGIETGAITEDGWIAIQHGFGRGFDSYREDRSFFGDAPGQIEITFSAARAWLSRQRQKQFFLFLHTYQVHSPFTPDGKYATFFTEQDGVTVDESAPLHLRQKTDYDREIRETDDALRGLVTELQRLGLSDDTVFILTADHGEEFLEHGQLGHGANLYEEVTHVPLMLVGPGIPIARRVAPPVGLADLAPTVLDLFGVTPPAEIEGMSLMAAIHDDAGLATLVDRPQFTESQAEEAVLPEGWVPVMPPFHAVRVGALKLLRFRTGDGFRYELYDLDADPRERSDIHRSRGAEAEGLVALIDGYEQRCLARRSAVLATEAAVPDESLSPEQLRKLHGLGYVE